MRTSKISKTDRALISKWKHFKKYDVKVCTISELLFGKNINLIVGDGNNVERFFLGEFDKKVETDSALGMYIWFTDEKGVRWKFIFFRDNKFYPTDYGIIAHEVHHLTHYCLEEVGIKYNRETNEEVFAYFQGYFMEKIIKAFIMYK